MDVCRVRILQLLRQGALRQRVLIVFVVQSGRCGQAELLPQDEAHFFVQSQLGIDEGGGSRLVPETTVRGEQATQVGQILGEAFREPIQIRRSETAPPDGQP